MGIIHQYHMVLLVTVYHNPHDCACIKGDFNGIKRSRNLLMYICEMQVVELLNVFLLRFP